MTRGCFKEQTLLMPLTALWRRHTLIQNLLITFLAYYKPIYHIALVYPRTLWNLRIRLNLPYQFSSIKSTLTFDPPLLALTVWALIPLMHCAFEPCMHADTQHPRSPLLVPRCRRARPSHQITCCYVQPQQQRSIAICWGHTCRGPNEWLAFWWLAVPPVFSPPASQIAAHCWDRGLF